MARQNAVCVSQDQCVFPTLSHTWFIFVKRFARTLIAFFSNMQVSIYPPPRVFPSLRRRQRYVKALRDACSVTCER